MAFPQNATAQAERRFWGGVLAEPPRPDWMQTDKALQVSVQVQAKGRPLGIVLEAVSRQTGVDIHASRRLREQRVSLAVGPVPLFKLMSRLQDLMGHGALPSNGYEWERTVAEDKSLHYALIQNRQGVQEEAAMLDRPLRTAERWLREMRDYGRLSSKKRKTFKTDWPILQDYIKDNLNLSAGAMGPVREIYGTLSDAQIAALVRQGNVTVSAALSSEALTTLGVSSPSSAPAAATLYFRGSPFGEGDFTIEAAFSPVPPKAFNYGDGLDTLNQLPFQTDIEALEQSRKSEKGTSVNLLRPEKIGGGNSVRMSLPLALDLLAREAKITIFAEVFLRRPQELPATTGKPEYLLSQICRVYDCDWRKVGGDYLVYSRRWAQDRAADIPQAQIDKWAASRQKQGRFAFTDLLEMARLSDRQMKTLGSVFDFQILPRNRDALRFAASLAPGQLRMVTTADNALIVPDKQLSPAYQPQGAELDGLSETQIAALPTLFGREQVTAPVRLKLTQETLGTTMTLSDPQGMSRAFYQYQGGELPAAPARPLPSAGKAGAGKP